MSELNRLDQYLNRRKAAEFLGISPQTLATWQRNRTNKIRVYTHPVTGWPMYRREDLEKFLREI